MKSFKNAALAAAAVATLALVGSASAQTVNFQIDDGQAENSIGLTAGGTFLFANSFPNATSGVQLTSVSVPWQDLAPGTSIQLDIFDDPNGDGNPSDAVSVYSATETVVFGANDSLDTTPEVFDTYAVPNVAVGSSFFIGFTVTNHPAGTFPAMFDQSAPISNRSFISLGTDITAAAPIESFGLVGNWMIRAEGVVPEPASLSMLGLGALGLLRRRR